MRSRTRWLPPATTASPQLSLRPSTIARLRREFVSAWIPPRHPQITTRLASSPPTEFFDQNQWCEKMVSRPWRTPQPAAVEFDAAKHLVQLQPEEKAGPVRPRSRA